MLTISRRKNESLVIGNNIVLTVVEVRGDKVRLAVTCPKTVPVHRQEIFDAIHGLSHPEPPPRSPEERPFLQAILEDPDDEATRLVFADWLEERGDPLAEFLRNQSRLALLSPTDTERWELEGRQQALWAEHGAAWRASLPLVLW